jgi:hypothetical protein
VRWKSVRKEKWQEKKINLILYSPRRKEKEINGGGEIGINFFVLCEGISIFFA